MDNEQQNRLVGDVLSSIGKRNIAISKRVNNLESVEYPLLNYYGSMYQVAGTVIAIAVAGTYYPVTGMLVGLVKGWTFADPYLTCVKPGVYKVSYAISTSGMVNNNTATAAAQNGVVIPATRSDFLSASAGGHQQLSGVGLVDVAVGDTIGLVIANLTDADDPTVDTASVVLEKVGD